jgi:hypothetical protein
VEETNSLGVPRAKIQKQREPKSHERLAKGLGTGVREFRKGAEGSYEVTTSLFGICALISTRMVGR